MGLPTKGVSVLAARRLWWPLTLVAALLVAPHAHYGAATVPSRAAAPADQAFTLASAPSTSARPASSQIAGVEMELGGLDRRLATLDAQIPSTKAQIASDRQELVTLERAIYVQPSSLLVLAGEAGNVTDLLDRLAEVTSVGAHAHAVELSLNSNVALLSVEKEQRQVAADHRARLYAELVGLSAAQVWDQITIWERANQNLTFPVNPAHSTEHPFVWPEPAATIGQAFGPTSAWMEPPYDGFAHFHTGIDLDEPWGSAVHAAADGIVIAVGYDSFGYGRYVVLGHAGGIATLYGHLSAAAVKVGDQVTQGQVIAREGSTGNSTGPHCHFEVRTGFQSKVGGVPVDPASYLPPGPPSNSTR